MPHAPSPTQIASFIEREALSLGFSKVGFTDVSPLTRGKAALSKWLEQSYDGSMSYMGKLEKARSNPAQLMDEAVSVVALAMRYPAPKQSEEPGLRGQVAAYAQCDDYHLVFRSQAAVLVEKLEGFLGRQIKSRLAVDSAPILEHEVAERAGIGFVGKNTLTIIPESGSFLHLGELLLDLPLPLSEPIVRDCGKCEICLDVCPTGAFVGPYVLDARRCISYLTIENRDSIPRDLRPLIGTRVFGCDECQTACPYNRSMAHNAAESPLVAHEHLSTPLLEEWLQLGSSAHKRLVRGTALSRASRNQLARNAAVALGNLEEESAIGALKKTLESHTDAIVREHAAWALGKIGTKEAADILRDATDDADERVREEIKMSLADIGFGTTDIQKL